MKAFLVLSCLVLAVVATEDVVSDRLCNAHADCNNGEICQFAYDCHDAGCQPSKGMCFPGANAESEEEFSSFVEVASKTSFNGYGGMNVTSLTINAPAGQPAELKLGEGDSVYTLAVKEEGHFVISQGAADLFSVDQNGNVAVKTRNFVAGSVSVGGNFIIEGMKQWRLFYHEDFSKEPIVGWSNISVSECGGVAILGGYCKFSQGEVTKTYTNLTEHTQLRIVATYHFIDAWEGETGYMQVDNGRDNAMEYVWTERYDQTQSVNAINICGNHHSEGRFSSPIDVTIPHTDAEIKIGFGATLDQDPCDESFGVSALQIYLR